MFTAARRHVSTLLLMPWQDKGAKYNVQEQPPSASVTPKHPVGTSIFNHQVKTVLRNTTFQKHIHTYGRSRKDASSYFSIHIDFAASSLCKKNAQILLSLVYFNKYT